ncbi:TIGR02270 family protein [Chondromyces apiculatus]|uniref:HEAT repeat protein n=1 Tax=Chondromyces apiculatus DSM 436 TaxID=1192034 RepID=A0A017TD30_9BACT|nr:TIGR02270 family protein [Chondromyces apiculatus]EYF06832.1 HEAT repeat protein [Chondromyces apiculatus DSM 436]
MTLTTIEEDVCEEHARQATFLWLLRDAAVRDAAYDLTDLAELDDRLEAHLDGLRLAGDVGWEACASLLAEPEGGEIFAAAVLAVDRWDLRGVARALDLGAGAPDLARGFASALGWTPLPRVKRLLPGLLAARCPPALHWLGIAACAAHRHDPGTPLGYALFSEHPTLRARALRLAGELGRANLLPDIQQALTADSDVVRFWATWSAALLGDPAAARPLFRFATAGGRHAERAADLAMRRMDPAAAATWLYSLASTSPDPRVPLAAASALGDPALVPWLLEQMSSPALARLAGLAFTLITGLDLAAEKLDQKPPEGFQAGPTDDPADENVSLDPDESLPFPDPAALAAWWRTHAPQFKRGTRHLLGHPLTPEHLERVLRTASQPARAAAALELSIRHRGRPLFEIRAPGLQQAQALAAR